MGFYLNEKGKDALSDPQAFAMAAAEIDFLEIIEDNPGIEAQEAIDKLTRIPNPDVMYRGASEVFNVVRKEYLSYR